MTEPFYYLEVFANNCIIEVTVNGLFLTRSDAKNGSSLNYPFNTELIGKGNTVTVSAFPTLLDSGVISLFPDVEIKGALKKYQLGDIAGPESGEIIEVIDFEEVKKGKSENVTGIAALAALFPLQKSYVFDNETLDFKNRLVDASVINDKDKLLDYGVFLRNLLERQDLDKLCIEFEPKLKDYGVTYPQDLPDPVKWFRDFMRDDFFPGGPITAFDRDAIGLKSWCEGKVWELFIKPTMKFFSNRGEDGDINEMEIYVGLVDNQFKIIR
jgi:hypothetical protein